MLKVVLAKRMLTICALVAAFAGHISWSPAALIPWAGNGHCYEYVPAPGITWGDALADAVSRTHLGAQGYLATVTSQAENDFLAGAYASEPIVEAWLGGLQSVTGGDATRSLEDEGWQWISGEPWVYTNWAPNEPNDDGQDEVHLMIWGEGVGLPERRWKWNDDGANSDPRWKSGFIVEYDVPEPTTLMLAGLGGLGLLLRKKR